MVETKCDLCEKWKKNVFKTEECEIKKWLTTFNIKVKVKLAS